jgi:hypothetical protein
MCQQESIKEVTTALCILKPTLQGDKLVKIYRWLFIGVGLIFLTSNIYTASFGTFPYQIEKQSSDLEVEYRIGFINPSSSPVEVTLSSIDSDEYNLTFSEQEFRVPPGKTADPSGSGWYNLGGGEYAKIHETSFSVDISRYRQDNRLSFPINIEAVSLRETADQEGSSAELIQVRNYNYRAEIDPSLRPDSRPEKDSDSSWRDSFWQEDNSESQEDFNLEQNKSSNQDRQRDEDNQNLKNSSKTSVQKEPRSDNTLVNGTTLVFLVGILVSLSYIMVKV